VVRKTNKQTHQKPNKKPNTKQRQEVFAGLDIGTSKVCCFIAVREEGASSIGGRPRVIGIGHQISRGLKNGQIVDLSAVESSILNAVHRAEEMAGETIKSVVVSVNGAGMKSHHIDVEIGVSGEVSDQDITRVVDEGQVSYVNGVEHEMVHFIPTDFVVDECSGVQDPRGMYGSKLGAHLHSVTSRQASLKNLEMVIQRCYLEVEGFVVAPYAAGLSTLVEDELDLGSVIIDMGAGTTSIAIFEGRQLAWADCIPVGGQHVTNDIAAGLATPLSDAERLKTLHGSALQTVRGSTEMMEVPVMGEESHGHVHSVPKDVLVDIIRPRMEETFELVKQRLQQSGVYKPAGHRMVMTGGASQLNGAVELAQMVLQKQIRLARPIKVAGLADATNGPAFSCAAGLLNYRLRPESLIQDQYIGGFTPSHGWGQGWGMFSRLSHWLNVG